MQKWAKVLNKYFIGEKSEHEQHLQIPFVCPYIPTLHSFPVLCPGSWHWQSSYSLWLPVGFSQWSFLTIDQKEGGEWSWDILLDPFLTLAISFSHSFLLCKNYSRVSVTFSSSCPFGFRVETTLLWTDWVLLHSMYIFVLSSFDY